MKIAAENLQYVPSEVVLRDSGAVPNLSTDVVQMAFPAQGVKPIAGDWKAASWETDATATPSRYFARCLVGPGGAVTLAAGIFDVWVKVTHSPELPVLKSRGSLEVF